jgi:hypothetical protein
MLTGKVDIERPRLLAVICLALTATLGAAQLGTWGLRDRLLSSPQTIVEASDELIAALAQAPFAADPAAADGLWLVGLVGCEGCDAATAEAIAALDRADLTPQVLLAPRSYPAPPEAARLVATVARSGDVRHFHAWLAGDSMPDIVTDPAEAEGYGELARQSAGRLVAILEANGLEATPPLVIWRRGADWRAASAADADIGRRVRRDRSVAGH